MTDFYEKAQDEFDGLFGPVSEVVHIDPPKQELVVKTIYRGFDAEIDKIDKTPDGKFILDPKKCEQNSLWFSDRRADAEGRGEFILEYQLPCVKHSQKKIRDDGSSFDVVPEEIEAQTEPTENCRFHMGVELPEGWFFSYKVQKYIICTIKIEIEQGSVSKDQTIAAYRKCNWNRIASRLFCGQ